MALDQDLRIAIDGKWRHVRVAARQQLADMNLAFNHELSMEDARERTLAQLKELIPTGIPGAGFREDCGGGGDPGMAVTGIEMLAQYDLSLMVKAGVQWGLFGGAVQNLGTERHHKLIPDIINLDLVGCFAMTETGHGSDVQSLEVTATYDAAAQEFVINSPTPSSRKDYIGNAAKHATVAAVFAQLISPNPDGTEVNHGVHCFLVPIRDAKGRDMPGVTTSDCGHKGGLRGVDNGRIMFDQVRVPRENLLNRYGDVAEDGTYSSPVDNVNRRFFTMLGTLVRGRVSVGGSASAAAEVGLTIAGKYAVKRRQFGAPGEEVVLMDYRTHQRRLLPLIAKSYAYRFAQNQLVARMDRLQRTDEPDEHEQRELETRAAGLKAVQTWHAIDAIQEAREACGGAGYLTENRLVLLRRDVDVFATFEGDNYVLMQLLAKDLLTKYAKEVAGLDPVGLAMFAATSFATSVKERTAAGALIQRLIDARSSRGEDSDLLDRGTQLSLFEDREERVLDALGRRLRKAAKADADEAFRIFNNAQDHVVRAARVHIEKVVLEAFTAGIARTEEGEAAELLRDVCTLYALTSIEDDLAWFMGHNKISIPKAKEVLPLVNAQCEKLRPHTEALVEGFGVAWGALRIPILAD
jgi:acyl-CoA oxidase